MQRVGIQETTVFTGTGHRDSVRALFVHLELDGDISGMLPYVHARTTACRYRTSPIHARFYWNGKECVLYPCSAVVGLFDDPEDARAFGPTLLALIHSIDRERSRILPAEPDRTPLKAMDVLRILPRTNCRRCGFATCLAFSVAVAQGAADPWACPFFPAPHQSQTRYLIPGIDANRPLVLHAGQHQAPRTERRSKDGPSHGPPEHPVVGNVETLTERELQVLELMALGFSNKEIAESLRISPHTVKTHSVHIFEKLDCTDRTQASVWAARAGLV